MILAIVLYIYYLFCFLKDANKVWVLLDLSSEVNTMMPAYTLKLGLKVRQINVGAQKIDGSILKTFKIILASFQVKKKLWKARFFEKTFLLANISINWC